MSSAGGWIRTPAARMLLWAALVLCLALGAGFVVVHRPLDQVPGPHATPLSDAAAVAQVVDAARQVVADARLRQATGGYTFMSCTGDDDPPYQVALYLTFALPENGSARYLADVADTMTAHGWAPSAAVEEHFGHKLSRDGVTAVLYRTRGDRHSATMRMYGECRATTDHRDDNPAWTEVRL